MPRPSGKYLPSQVRTQKAGPEAPTDALRCGGGASAGVLRPNGSEKKLRLRRRCAATLLLFLRLAAAEQEVEEILRGRHLRLKSDEAHGGQQDQGTHDSRRCSIMTQRQLRDRMSLPERKRSGAVSC
jgi:hypothetical protein